MTRGAAGFAGSGVSRTAVAVAGTATERSGYIDGAVQSGERAAREAPAGIELRESRSAGRRIARVP